MRDSSGWPTILVYHHVAEAGGPALDKLDVTTSPDVFESHIKYCSKNFDMIDVSDLQDLRRIRRPLLVTFDDNYGSVVSDAAKILKSFSVPSIVFLNPGVLLGKTLPIDNLLSLAENRLGPDRLRSCLGLAADSSSALAHMIWRTLPNMSQPQLQAAKGALLDALGTTIPAIREESGLFLDGSDLATFTEFGMKIGNHSMDHAFFRSLTPAERERQIVESREVLERLSGQVVSHLSIPYGSEDDATPEVLEVARRSGHRATFLVQGRSNRVRPHADVFYRISLRNMPAAKLPIALHVAPLLRSALHRSPLRPPAHWRARRAPGPHSSGTVQQSTSEPKNAAANGVQQ